MSEILPCGKTGNDVLGVCSGTRRYRLLGLSERSLKVMQQSVRDGLENDGVLPGGLNLRRKAVRSHWQRQL